MKNEKEINAAMQSLLAKGYIKIVGMDGDTLLIEMTDAGKLAALEEQQEPPHSFPE